MPQNQILTGMGNFSILASTATTPRLLNVEPMEFELAGDAESLTSTKWVNGVLQTAGIGRSTETWTLTIGVEALNWTTIQLALSEFAGTTASYNLPKMKYATVPASAPYTITDAEVLNGAVVYAVYVDTGAPLTAGATAATGTFVVSANTLTFAVGDAGRDVAYRVLRPLTNISTIGVETTFSTIGNLRFDGVAYGDVDDIHIAIPQMAAAGLPTITFGDVTKFDLEYTLSIATGQRRTFTMAKLPKNS